MALIVSLVGMATLNWYAEDRRSTSDVQERLAPPYREDMGQSDGTPIPDGPSTAASRTDFSRADTAASALAALQQLGPGRDHDAVEGRIYLAGVCGLSMNQDYAEHLDGWARIQLLNYCKDYFDPALQSMSVEQLLEFQALGTRGRLEAMIREREDNRQGAILDLEDIVLGSESPWEVHAALQIASEREYGLPVVIEAIPDSNLTDVRDILSLVAELQYCELSGGCGPKTVATLRGCIFTGICGPTIDYLSQLRQVYSPEIFAAAITVHQSINRSRSNGK